MALTEFSIGDLLRAKGLTLGTVESGTGGLVSHFITNVPGSSDYFLGGIVSYANEVKTKLAGVKSATLKKYGAVSPLVAEEMAAGGRKTLKVDICVSDTGIAGPGGATPDKPVGLFYIGLACPSGVFNKRFVFSGTREEIKLAVADAALDWVKEYLGSL